MLIPGQFKYICGLIERRLAGFVIAISAKRNVSFEAISHPVGTYQCFQINNRIFIHH